MPKPLNAPINPEALYRAHECARLFGISISTWWRWTNTGRAKCGIRLSPKITVWDGAYILELRQELLEGSANQ